MLNLLGRRQYAYGHNEVNDDDHTKGDLASRDHMYIVEALCRSTMPANEPDLIELYFHKTVDQIGRVEEEDDFSALPPLLYFQPCYGYYGERS